MPTITCKECAGKGTVDFTKERGAPGCNNCNGIGVMTREVMRLRVGRILDGNSIYMGGPSHQSLRNADKVLEYFFEQGVL